MATIIGTIGNDDLTGSSGDDLIYGYDPANQAATDGGNDTLAGLDGNDTLYGGRGNDTLTGGAGNDILNGGAGSDLMTGGTGSDTYHADTNDTIVEDPADPGIDTIYCPQSLTLFAGVENLTLTGTADSYGIGNNLDNLIIGNNSANRLEPGSAGTDTLVGKAGNDTYFVTRSGITIVEEANGGTDTIQTTISYALPDFVENESVFGDAVLDLMGNSLDNRLTADFGDNLLSGLDGNDSLSGGRGNDTLIGGAGDDWLQGGDGFDTADYSSAPGAVFLNVDAHWVVTGAAGRDSLTAIEHVVGSNFNDVLLAYAEVTTLDGGAGNDTLTGSDQRDVLNGGSGNDSLSGGAAMDTLVGGAGDDVMDGGSAADTADYSAATLAVFVNLTLSGPQFTGNATGKDTLSNIENVTGGTVRDVLSGNGLDNVLLGLTGNDTLAGGAGNDTLDGGAGNDTLHGDAGNDLLIGGTGTDLMYGDAGIDTADYTGDGRNVTVSLTVTTAQDTGYGSDTLSGIENLTTGAGTDRLVGSTAANVIHGGAGNDGIVSLGGADQLYGEDGADILQGGAGNDLLVGGAGADVLVGGPDSDTFRYKDITETAVGQSHDKINDFQVGLDHTDLSAIDANLLVAGDQAFTFIGSLAFSHQAAQLHQTDDGAGNTLIEGDIQGDGVADFQIWLKGGLTLTSSDFVL